MRRQHPPCVPPLPGAAQHSAKVRGRRGRNGVVAEYVRSERPRGGAPGRGAAHHVAGVQGSSRRNVRRGYRDNAVRCEHVRPKRCSRVCASPGAWEHEAEVGGPPERGQGHGNGSRHHARGVCVGVQPEVPDWRIEPKVVPVAVARVEKEGVPDGENLKL